MNYLFDSFVYYLPVFLPFSLALFSVIARIVSGAMKPTLSSFLKTYTDIALGLFSFSVWTLVSLIQTKRIQLNTGLEISSEKILILLIFNVMLLFVTSIVSRQQWAAAGGPTAFSQRWLTLHKEKLTDSIMMVFCLFMFVLPVFLATPIQPIMQTAVTFRVVIPYDDPTLARQIGAVRWGQRKLCEITVVVARDPRAAKESARALFQKSLNAHTIFARGAEKTDVAVVEDFVLAASGRPEAP